MMKKLIESIQRIIKGKQKDSIKKLSSATHPACGMWRDRVDMVDVGGYVYDLRKGRFGDFRSRLSLIDC